jgi:predicted transcriptional regulator
MPKIRVNLTIDPELWERTKRLARERHTSASALVASALEEALRGSTVEARLEIVRRMAARSLPIATPEEIDADYGRRLTACSPEDEPAPRRQRRSRQPKTKVPVAS